MGEKKSNFNKRKKNFKVKNTKATVCPVVSTIPTRFNYFIKMNKHALRVLRYRAMVKNLKTTY